MIGGKVADMAAAINADQANWFARDREEDAARAVREAERERQLLQMQQQEEEEDAAALAEHDAEVARCRVLAAGNTQPEDIAEDDRDLVQRIRNQQSLPDPPPRRITGKGKGKGKGKPSAVFVPDPNAAWPPPLTPERQAQLAEEAQAKVQRERAATGEQGAARGPDANELTSQAEACMAKYMQEQGMGEKEVALRTLVTGRIGRFFPQRGAEEGVEEFHNRCGQCHCSAQRPRGHRAGQAHVREGDGGVHRP